MYADYTYYTTTYLSSALTEEEFARASTRASSFLDYYTRGKAKTYTGDELKMCCCALGRYRNAVSWAHRTFIPGRWLLCSLML